MPEHPNRQSSQALRDTGKACLAAGDRNGAITAFAQAYRLMPTAMDLYEALLDLYMATGRAKDGSKFFEDMSRLAPKAVAFLFARGRLKAEQGLALEAAKIFEQAAALAPTSSGMKYWRGCALLQAGHYKPAIEAFTQSLSLSSPSPQESNECSDRKKDAEMLLEIRPALKAARKTFQARSETTFRDTWEQDAVASIQKQLGETPITGLAAVFFHVEAGDRHPFLQKLSSSSQAVDYKQTLLQACQAVTATNAGATVIVLTDEFSDLSVLEGAARIARLSLVSDQLMYGRAREQSRRCDGSFAGPSALS